VRLETGVGIQGIYCENNDKGCANVAEQKSKNGKLRYVN
jgi:hypothetical protein